MRSIAALVVVVVVALSMVIAPAVTSAAPPAPGAAYTMTNSPTGNEVVVFDRDAKGMLTLVDRVSTQGNGLGAELDPLASQNSLILSRGQKWLLAVNAGSNEISVFQARQSGLEFVDKVSSGGTMPVSLTILNHRVYVLNAGGTPNITGFILSSAGQLTPIDDSTRTLEAGAYAQVGFDPKGNWLVLTDKTGNKILVFSVTGGLPSADAVISPSNGATPFGFIFGPRGRLIVVEAGANAVSTYNIMNDGTLQVISGSVPNGQTAACWITKNQRGNVYTTNPGTNSVSAYKFHKGPGTVTLQAGVAGTGNTPLDIDITQNGRFLYAVDPTAGGVDMFKITADGSLVSLGMVDADLSIFAQGLAAR